MTYLLDANVLIAWYVEEHADHEKASHWINSNQDILLICPTAQGSLFRYLIRDGKPASTAANVTASMLEFRRCHWVPDDLGYQDVRWDGVVGHHQVTDVYLADLARKYGALLATFDKGIAGLRPDATYLIS